MERFLLDGRPDTGFNNANPLTLSPNPAAKGGDGPVVAARAPNGRVVIGLKNTLVRVWQHASLPYDWHSPCNVFRNCECRGGIRV